MPKAPSDDLFKLIKSLSPAEKGYFKKRSFAFTGKKNSDYSVLFDLIDAQKIYDESSLINKFAGV